MACGNEIVSRYGSDQISQPTTASSPAGMYISSNATPSQVRCHEARLIVQDFKMQQDVDYNDTFSPTPGSTATRTTHDADAHSALKRCARGLECTQHSVHSKS